MSAFKPGDDVFVFSKYCPWNAACKFMVAKTIVAGTSNPRLTKSDGWMSARVSEVYDRDPTQALAEAAGIPQSDSTSLNAVRVQYKDKIWVDAVGQILEERSTYQNFKPSVLVSPDQVPEIKLSVLCVRWGGATAVDGNRFDFAVTDKLIQECLDSIYEQFPQKNLEIFTAYISSSSDLHRVSELWAMEAMAPHSRKVGLYFLWGSNSDGKPGYVLSSDLVGLMERMESVGIVTKYPNHSHLYKQITSKEYQASMCLNEQLALPPTVAVPASLWLQDPQQASFSAMEALSLINPSRPPITDGVVKVGCAWMNDGVRLFKDQSDLHTKALSLLNSSHGRSPAVLVQHRIKSLLCEPKVFVFNGVVKGIRYTWHRNHDERSGRVSGCNTRHKSQAAKLWFEGDVRAQQYVEKRIGEIVKRWNSWLIAVSGEVPVFVRIDFLVERLDGNEEAGEDQVDTHDAETESLGAGDSVLPSDPITAAEEEAYGSKYKVWTCELGEIGSSMVGFHDGRKMLFDAIAESCTKRRPTRPAPKPPARNLL